MLHTPTRIVLAVSLIVGASPSRAQIAHVMGAGIESCGTWVSDRRIPNSVSASQDAQWALGFLSGIGMMGSGDADPLNDLDYNAVMVWLDNYCATHPLNKIADAIMALNHAHPK
jgi:hypothetical protein